MIRVVEGDLAAQQVTAVVRPIRSDLAPVNALSRDLAAAAGPKLGERLESVGSIPVGGAVITPAGDLPADFVIHVVVMSEDEPQTPTSARRALRNGLARAADWALDSLAVPPLGLGVGTLDAEEAARSLVETLFDHLDEGRPPLELTIVVGSEYEAGLFGRIVEDVSRERARD